jgi:hypothetical protein
MVHPSSGRQKTSKQQPGTTEEEVDIVELMTQIRAKSRVAYASLGGDVVQGLAGERSNGGGAPVKKQIWKFEKAMGMAGPGGLWF